MWALLALACFAACHGRSDAGARARERVLARIPADATAVLAADGSALAHPRIRGVIDVLAPRWPARMACAIDAMLGGEQIAIGIGPRGTTLVIATSVAVECPALSNLGDGLWVATLGAGTIASEASVLDAPGRARARRYLLASPIAAVIDRAGGTLIAAATPEPLEAWLAFDTTLDLAPIVERRLAGYRTMFAGRPVTGPFAAKLEIERAGSQVVAALHGPVDADLAVAVRLAVDELAGDEPSAPAAWSPAPFTVRSIESAVATITGAPLTPVIVNSRVRGLRLGAAVPTFGLRAGDVLIGAGERALVDRAQLAAMAGRGEKRLELVVERGHVTTTLSLEVP